MGKSIAIQMYNNLVMTTSRYTLRRTTLVLSILGLRTIPDGTLIRSGVGGELRRRLKPVYQLTQLRAKFSGRQPVSRPGNTHLLTHLAGHDQDRTQTMGALLLRRPTFKLRRRRRNILAGITGLIWLQMLSGWRRKWSQLKPRDT